jgi:hypothetical protein
VILSSVTLVRGLGFIAAALAAGLACAAAAPAAKPVPGQQAALDAVRRANLSPAEAVAARAEIARAARLVRGLPASRGAAVGQALQQLAAFEGRLTGPRAAALVGQLKANNDYFALHGAPAPQTDVIGADGLLYRWFPGRCLEFHPLGEFALLNAAVAQGDAAATQKIADALAARGVHPRSGGVVWEYYFDYSGGRAPWTSGMAQAVAAQAFARAANVVTPETSALAAQARAAYQAIPGSLMTAVNGAPWIRLYSFQRTAVLNAQLQTVISLASYANDAEDQGAATLAGKLEQSALTNLPRFDTGYWTYYALPSDTSDLHYQQYVVQLLTKLKGDDPRFADAAKRFAAYAKQPPAFRLDSAGVGQVRFWLSKPSSVTATSAAGPTRRLTMSDGWHTLSWAPKRPGIYAVHVNATDPAANSAAFDALPIVKATAAGTGSPGGVRAGAAAPGAPPPPLVVGTALADPSQAAQAQKLGLRLVRFGVQWPAGATAPDPGAVAALQSVPGGMSDLVELNVGTAPADDAGRRALVAYASSLASQVPAMTRLVLLPAPGGSASLYAAAFAAVRDGVKAVAPSTAVGIAVDGAVTPKAAVVSLGRALGAVAPDFVAFHPVPQPAAGQWAEANLPQLTAVLKSAFGGVPPVLLDGVVAPTPATITGYACSGGVAGIVLDRLSDVSAISAAATDAQRGNSVCPGVAQQVTATTLQFPSAANGAVQLACQRDCLYLVTLDDARGRPVVAARGALTGGAGPTAITLPSAKLASGGYRFDVRLVSRTNPGSVSRTVSPPVG